jgi:hypothetical protein
MDHLPSEASSREVPEAASALHIAKPAPYCPIFIACMGDKDEVTWPMNS